MAKLEIDLPDYMVGKRQKGTRSNGGAPYVLYYWQPWKELRAAGFQSVPLGRDLSKAIATAQRLNDRLSAWRRGEDPDPGSPPKIRHDPAFDRSLPGIGRLSRQGSKDPGSAMIAVWKSCASGRLTAAIPKWRRSPPRPARAAQGLEMAAGRAVLARRWMSRRPPVPFRTQRAVPGRAITQCQCSDAGCLDPAWRRRR